MCVVGLVGLVLSARDRRLLIVPLAVAAFLLGRAARGSGLQAVTPKDRPRRTRRRRASPAGEAAAADLTLAERYERYAG